MKKTKMLIPLIVFALAIGGAFANEILLDQKWFSVNPVDGTPIAVLPDEPDCNTDNITTYCSRLYNVDGSDNPVGGPVSTRMGIRITE